MQQRDLSFRQTTLDLVVDKTDPDLPKRADIYLSQKIAARTRTQLRRVFDEKRVLANDHAIAQNFKLRGGETIKVLLDPETPWTPPEQVPLEVVYEDEFLLAVNKSAGILMHPAGTILSGTLINAVHYYMQSKNDPCLPSLLQRLDKDTSGLVILPKDADTYRKLHADISSRKVKKLYLALCEKNISPPEGWWDYSLVEDPSHPTRKRMKVEEGGKPSLTYYQKLWSDQHSSLLGIRLFTGRQHQIRVHAAHTGHPLLGDDLYLGTPLHFKRQALHSYALYFYHPALKKEMILKAPLPQDFVSFFKSRAISQDSNISFDPNTESFQWNPQSLFDKSDGALPPNWSEKRFR